MAKRVLLITPRFYGIERKIKSVLEESKYEVIWIENKSLPLDYHGSKSKFRFLRKIYFFIFIPQVWYLRKELRKLSNSKFDILLSINASIICRFLFRKLKKANPQLYSVVYFWDSFSMFNWTRELKFFTKAFTFDPEDSNKYHMEYKPNFYINSITTRVINQYDLFFVGKFSVERLTILDTIIDSSQNHNINLFIRLWPASKIFLHTKLVYWLLNKVKLNSPWIENYLFNYEAVEGILDQKYLVSESIHFDKVQNESKCSNVILDLPYKNQTGYTHRLIEALATGKKVITTNSNIKRENFFNPDQIHILDDQNPKIDFSWIKETSDFPVNEFFSNLELTTWLKSVINVEAV